MEIVIKLQVEEYEEPNATFEITADMVRQTFNVGDKYSACVSATVSMGDKIIEM